MTLAILMVTVAAIISSSQCYNGFVKQPFHQFCTDYNWLVENNYHIQRSRNTFIDSYTFQDLKCMLEPYSNDHGTVIAKCHYYQDLNITILPYIKSYKTVQQVNDMSIEDRKLWFQQQIYNADPDYQYLQNRRDAYCVTQTKCSKYTGLSALFNSDGFNLLGEPSFCITQCGSIEPTIYNCIR